MKIKRIYLLFLFFIALHSYGVKAQVCDELIPICSSQDGLDNNAVDESPIDINTTCQDLQGTRTAWYYILIEEATDFTFQIEPNGNVDYDFAVWKNADCANLGDADRGSFDAPGAGQYDTGLDMPSTDTCETAAGDGDVMFMALVPGDEIIIVVDRFSNTADIFDLSFGDPDAFNCSIVLTESCDGETETLDATDPNGLGYTWSFENPIGSNNFDPFVPAETSETLEVTETGNYRVIVDLPGSVTDTRFFDVVFYPQPVIENTPENLFQCDDGTSGGVFDLTQNTPIVLGTQTPGDFEVNYYENFADSDADENAIPNPTMFPIGSPPQQPIFLRIHDASSGTCYALSDFNITFSVVSVGAMTNYNLCDLDDDGFVDLDLPLLKNTEALGPLEDSLYLVSYHGSQIDADAGNNPHPVPYTVTGPAEEIFVRVENIATPTCFAVDSFFINLASPQIENPPIDLLQCDDGINTGVFDLTVNTPIVLGSQDPADFIVSYHNTATDADTGADPIATPTTYPITGTVEEVFVRVEGSVEDTAFLEDFGTGLGRVVSPFTNYIFNLATQLNAGEYAVTNNSTGLNTGWHQAMEDYTSGDIDGRMIVFDATDAVDELYRREITVAANTDYSFEFVMTTMYDTDSGICPGTGIDSRVVYEIEDATGTVIATNSTGNVVNESNPNWINYSLTFNSGPNTSIQIVLNNDITGVCGNDLAIDDIRVIIQETCFATDSFLIEFAPISIGALTDSELCDDDDDGILEVDLSLLKDLEVLDTLDPLLYNITYHGSQPDADTGANAYSNLYTATGPSEIIFVRIENNANPSCFLTGSFELFIFEAPEATEPTPFILCDEFPNDGLAAFDLTIKDTEITGGDPNLNVTYHLTLTDAETGANAVDTTTPFINTIPSYQILYARVEILTNTNCFDLTELVLQVDESPAITDPISDYLICDDVSGDGVELFNLLSKDSEILNSQIGVSLAYFETEAEAIAGTPQIPTPNAYLSSGGVVWVRADNSAGCVTILSFNLIVGSAPVYSVVPTFELCDDIPLNDEAEFDLSSQNELITGGNPFLSVSYHLNQIDADNNVILPEPYTNISNPQTIVVRVEDNTTGCFETFIMDLQVIPPPDIFQPDPLEFCDPDNDGFGEFMLTDADSQVTGGVPTGNLQVTYHYLIEDAQNGANPLASPYLNDVEDFQTVHVRLVDQ
ncbi:MAG: hypothetical protein EVA38_03200, partial [Flavobacteriales bacterium]